MILPVITMEAGLNAPSVSDPSGALVLDDPTFGQLDTGTLGDSPEWTSFSNDIVSFTVNRTMTRQQGPLWSYQAGTATIVLDNSNGDYDPDNLSGPYVSSGVSLLRAMVPIRITASIFSVNYDIYHGYADAWVPTTRNGPGDYAELTLTATDATQIFNNINLPTTSIADVGDDSGAMVRDVLQRANWYTSAEFNNIDTGSVTLQGSTFGTDVLSLLQLITDSEIGQLYLDGSGAVVFRSRQAILMDTRSNTVQAVFGDSPGTSHSAGTELPATDIARARDLTTVINDVQATRVGGTLQEVQDSGSEAKYLFLRTYSRTDLLLQNDSDTQDWASWVLYIGKDDEDRIESLTVDSADDFDGRYNLWTQILGREIGDRVQVWTRPPALADPITKDCFIAGISHSWVSADSQWKTALTFQSADKYGSFLALDNPTLGRLDNNALA